MLARFARRRQQKRTAQNLYGSIVAAARRPEFYARYGVADTVEGRFEMLVAHMLVMLERLRRDAEQGKELSQALVDTFFRDMDTTTRELGVGDLAVPKRMRRLAAVYGERMRSYDAALAAQGNDELAELIAQNMNIDRNANRDAAALLARYVRQSVEALERHSLDELAASATGGALLFPAIAERAGTP